MSRLPPDDGSIDGLIELIQYKNRQRDSQRSPGPGLSFSFLAPTPPPRAHAPGTHSPLSLEPSPRHSRSSSPAVASPRQRSDDSLGPARFERSTSAPDAPSFPESIPDCHDLLMGFPWYAGAMMRAECETCLSLHDEGTFLVRRGQDGYAFSVKWTQNGGGHWCTHVKITYSPRFLFQMCAADSFASIADLVDFYSDHLDVFAHRYWPSAQLPPPPFVSYLRESVLGGSGASMSSPAAAKGHLQVENAKRGRKAALSSPPPVTMHSPEVLRRPRHASAAEVPKSRDYEMPVHAGSLDDSEKPQPPPRGIHHPIPMPSPPVPPRSAHRSSIPSPPGAHSLPVSGSQSPDLEGEEPAYIDLSTHERGRRVDEEVYLPMEPAPHPLRTVCSAPSPHP